MINHLSGSDLRLHLIRNRQRALDKFRKASQDINIMRAIGVEHIKLDNYLWAYAMVDSRSIWWNGKRHLVPLLDLVNCAELKNARGNYTSPHQTSLSVDNAITKATKSFKKGDQVFENYGQANHVYFTYHGFVMNDNSHDCALVDMGIDKSDTAASAHNMRETELRLRRNGFHSFSRSFCIRNLSSLDDLSNFLRIKHQLPGDNVGFGDDVVDLVRDLLVRRKKLYDRLYRFGHDDKPPYPVSGMKSLVDREKRYFEVLLTELGQPPLQI